MHRCQRFFNVLKHSWKAFLGMLRKCASEFVLIASIDWKRRSFSVDLSFGNRKKSAVQDLESTEAVEGQPSRVWPRSHGQETMNVRARCHVGASIDSPATHQVLHAQIFGKNFMAHCFEILTSSTTSRTVKRRFERMTSRTFATLSSVFDVDGRPERESSSTEVWPSLKRFHHSYIWVLPMAPSLNATFNISNVSVTDFPIFTQNFTQIRCSWKTLIFLRIARRAKHVIT